MTEVKASVYLKRLFRKAKLNPVNQNLTFKNFVRNLREEGDPLESAWFSYKSAWFSHKSALFNQEAKQLRHKNKGARISLEKAATKAARRKRAERSRNKGKSTETAATATPAKPEVKKV